MTRRLGFKSMTARWLSSTSRPTLRPDEHCEIDFLIIIRKLIINLIEQLSPAHRQEDVAVLDKRIGGAATRLVFQKHGCGGDYFQHAPRLAACRCWKQAVKLTQKHFGLVSDTPLLGFVIFSHTV